MVNNHPLDLISPRVLKITVTHAVCTWRCCTLALLRFERERMQLVYEFILLNKILRNRLLSEHMQWNYASFNVKSNKLTSISFKKIISPEILYMWPLIPCHSPQWNNPVFISCTITEFCVIGWHLWLWTTEGKNIVKLLAISPTCQFHSAIFNCDFQCLTLLTIQKYWFLLKLKQHIKQLQMMEIYELSHVK